jgi:hypothetical protein
MESFTVSKATTAFFTGFFSVVSLIFPDIEMVWQNTDAERKKTAINNAVSLYMSRRYILWGN